MDDLGATEDTVIDPSIKITSKGQFHNFISHANLRNRQIPSLIGLTINDTDKLIHISEQLTFEDVMQTHGDPFSLGYFAKRQNLC